MGGMSWLAEVCFVRVCCEVIRDEVIPSDPCSASGDPSQGHIVLCALNQHMAGRIYRPPSNQSAPFRASLRRARPISASGRDPCLLSCAAMPSRDAGKKECQHGSVARTRRESATTITRRRRGESAEIETAVDGAASCTDPPPVRAR